MTIDPISASSAVTTLTPAATAPTAEPAGRVDFSALLDQGLARVDGSLQHADASLQALAVGEPIAVHDVVIAMEQARIAMQFAVETRNRVVEAYQEFMRMQL